MKGRKGFTLAELLIVVAIVAVLVAVAIPVFTAQLEKSREATDLANIRSACSALLAEWIDHPEKKQVEVKAKQRDNRWSIGDENAVIRLLDRDHEGEIRVPATNDTYYISINSSGDLNILLTLAI